MVLCSYNISMSLENKVLEICFSPGVTKANIKVPVVYRDLMGERKLILVHRILLLFCELLDDFSLLRYFTYSLLPSSPHNPPCSYLHSLACFPSSVS